MSPLSRLLNTQCYTISPHLSLIHGLIAPHIPQEHPLRRRSRRGRSSSRSVRRRTRGTGDGVVAVETSGLGERQCRELEGDVLPSDDRTDDERNEEHEEREVEDGVADYATFPETRLLQRVDWGSDLTTAVLLVDIHELENGERHT